MTMRARVSPEPVSLLGRIALFEGVPFEALATAERYLITREVERGDRVLRKGEVGDQLLFLLSGRLQAVDVTEDGRELGLNFLLPGDYFGELSVIDGLPRSATVVAIDASEVAVLPRERALALIYHHPAVVERVLKRMAKSIRRASDYRSILAIPNAFQRVYALLAQMMDMAPGGVWVIERMPTQQEVAIMVNTSRESVSRAMQLLLEKGVIQKDLRRLLVRDPEQLRTMAARHQGA